MNYKNIRNNARSLYRQNFKLYILIVLAETAALAVNYSAGTLPFLKNVKMIGFCATVLTYPVTLGCMVFFYNEYLGSHGKLSDLLRFYCDKKQLVNALMLGVIMMLPGQIYAASNGLTGFLGAAYPSMPLWMQYIPGLLIGLAVLIFFLRTYPVPFIFGINPQMKPFSILKASFAKTRGYVFDYILFSLSVWWPLILVTIMLGSAIIGYEGVIPITILFFMFVPLYVFFMPYWYLCFAGFSSEIIHNGGELQ